jgi:hypothetical protein
MGSENVTPIRSDIATAAEPKRKRREPRGSGPKIDVEAMDTALNEQRGALFEAMGIVRLAARQAERGSSDDNDRVLSLGEATDVWTALEGAHKLLGRIADRLQSSEMMLADEVPRAEY